MWRTVGRQLSSKCRRLLSTKSTNNINNDYLVLSEEVQSAVNEGRGVVALESTVITHGLPYPHNLQLAQDVENVVRAEGCVPATVAVLNGNICVGLSSSQLQQLATCEASVKVSRRDLPAALANQSIGGTTVSATMFAAYSASIQMFATGGIGGVHRGVHQTMDISADLVELGRTPVNVVCAGVKSILDVPKTLEFLETQGVSVIVLGPNKQFPGFFTAKSGSFAPYSTPSIEHCAKLCDISDRAGLGSGLLIACAIPDDASLNSALNKQSIEQALEEARSQSISGARITPFLLQRVNELSQGESLKANLALLLNNASKAAQIEFKWAKMRQERIAMEQPVMTWAHFESVEYESTVITPTEQSEVVVIGATNIDFQIDASEPITMQDGTTYAGRVNQFCGGVGRNHADALTRLGIPTRLISAIGEDYHAEFFDRYCSHMNTVSVERMANQDTATYAAISQDGNMQFGIGNIDTMANEITPHLINNNEALIARAPLVILDGNVSTDCINAVVALTNKYNTKLWFDPADKRKVSKLVSAGAIDCLYGLSPNKAELQHLCALLNDTTLKKGLEHLDTIQSEQSIDQYIADVLPELINQSTVINRLFSNDTFETFVLTLGAHGVFVCKRSDNTTQPFVLIQVDAPINHDHEKVVSVSGAGDCFNCGLIWGSVLGRSLQEQISAAQSCARQSLLSTHPVPQSLMLSPTMQQ